MCLRLCLVGVVEVGLVGDRAGFLKVVGEEDWAGHVSESVGAGGMVGGFGL